MTSSGQQRATGYAPANGVDIYWESHGSGGTPLLLVHGGYGLASMFDGLAAKLAADRQVIAIELQGHGHTADIARSFTWDDFADDIAAVIERLGLGPVDLLGVLARRHRQPALRDPAPGGGPQARGHLGAVPPDGLVP